MEIKQIGVNVSDFFKKYRYAVIVLIIGVLLMNLPTGNSQKAATKTELPNQSTLESVEARLAGVLCCMKGVGRVEVMLTEASGPENVYQMDEDTTDANSNSSEKSKTVIVKDSNRNEVPLVRKTISTKYLGAIIVCDGAENPSVRLALVDAVCKLTGLGSDSISIVKMK